MTQKMVSGSLAHQVIQWLGWADEDYLGARVLLMGGYVVQGTILANTAIEKYFKAGMLNRGVPLTPIHNVSALYSQVQKSGKLLVLNDEFLKTLGKAYKLRYPDKLPVGFNVGLNAVKVLVELDVSVYSIRSGFKFVSQSQRAVVTKLDQMIRDNHPGLMTHNTAWGNASRPELFDMLSPCYELRVVDAGTILEVKYQAGPIPDDGIFEYDAFAPEPSNDPSKISYRLRYTPTNAPPFSSEIPTS